MGARFQAVKDVPLKQALDLESQQRDRQIPFGKFQFVDVTFAPGHEIDINHTLAPLNPDDVHWLIVKSVSPAHIYRALGAGVKAWTANTIFLTADAATTMRLMLFLEA